MLAQERCHHGHRDRCEHGEGPGGGSAAAVGRQSVGVADVLAGAHGPGNALVGRAEGHPQGQWHRHAVNSLGGPGQLQLDKAGVEWRYHLFSPVRFRWNDVEMVSLQRKGFGGKPYLVVYPKKDYQPTFSLPQFAQVVQRTKEKFGDKAGLSIDIGKLGVNEQRFRAVLEEMMRGSGFQIMREGRDVFYKKLSDDSGLQMPQYRPHG